MLTDIAQTSPQGARRVKDRIQAIIGLLLEQPRLGVLTGLRPMRRMVVRPYPYLVVYEATGDTVVIIGIRYAARDPASMPDGS